MLKKSCLGLITVLFLMSMNSSIKAQFEYKNTSLLEIIEKIEDQTSYRFLYRSSLISDIKISITETETNFFNELNLQLQKHNLTLRLQADRKQVIILKQSIQKPATTTVSINGQVLDAKTGERLPYATVTWYKNNVLKGVTTNESGGFSLSDNFSTSTLELTCSFFGYTSTNISLNISENNQFDDLTCRLPLNRFEVDQLIVVGSNAYSNLPQQASSMLDIGDFSPLGESNSISALQSLPSVSVSSLLSGQLQVRGSPSDGFRVLIDDITIYNQSHLYGLVDNFNSDILKRGGFYYDVAPANMQATPGGTLALITKTGSLNEFGGTFGLSNSAYRLSLDGPIKKGKSSWLISARKSYLNTVDWFNNNNLIKWGLDVDRPQSGLQNGLVNLDDYLTQKGNADASFFDVHGKVYFENYLGGRLTLSGYLGGDDISYKSERLYRSFANISTPPFTFRPVKTIDDWQNVAFSANYNFSIQPHIFSSTTTGLSIYVTSFNKDDFMYTQMDTNKNLTAFVFPFSNESVLNDFTFKQLFEIQKSPNHSLNTGFSYNYYLGEYAENSFNRPGYFRSITAHRTDLFAQLDYTNPEQLVDIFGGGRLHYYSNGKYVKFSPRIKLKILPQSKVSLGVGYSKNYQFLNQISMSNTISSNVWVLADKQQPPTSVDYYSTGMYFTPTEWFYAQIEAYYKEFSNLRLHEINTYSLSGTFTSNPWFTDNSGTAKGIEFFNRIKAGAFTISQSATISTVELTNAAINNGDSFFADWDRTFKYSLFFSTKITKQLSAHIAWNYASGTPNKLATFGPQADERLSSYKRTDLSLDYTKEFSSLDLTLSASIFNLFNNENVWYRDINIVLDQNSAPNRIIGAPVDVFDVGLQGAFNITVGF